MKKKPSWRRTPRIDRSWLEDESNKPEQPEVYSEDESATMVEPPAAARVEMEQLSERVRSMSEFSVPATPEYVPEIKAEQVVNVPANEQVFIPPVQASAPVVTVPANEQIFTPPVQAATPVFTPPAASTFVPPAQPSYTKPHIPVQPAFKPNIPAVPPTQRIAERLAQQRSEAARPVAPTIEAAPIVAAASSRPFYPESYFVPVAQTQPVVERTEKSIFAKAEESAAVESVKPVEASAPVESFAPVVEKVEPPPMPPAPPVMAATPVHSTPSATPIHAAENFFAPDPAKQAPVVREPVAREPQAPRYATGEPPAVRLTAPEQPQVRFSAPEPAAATPPFRPEIPAEPKFEKPAELRAAKPATPVFDPLFKPTSEVHEHPKFEEAAPKFAEPVRAKFEATAAPKHEEPAQERYSEFLEEAPRARFEPAINIPKAEEVQAVPQQEATRQEAPRQEVPRQEAQAPRPTQAQSRPRPEQRPTQPVHQREQQGEELSGLTRVLNAVRAAIPVVQRLLPLFEGNVAKAVSNLLAPTPSTAMTPAVQKVDIAPVERGLLELNKQHRELREQVAAQNQGLQRVEDQLMHVRTATDRNTLEQQELIEEMQKMEKRQGTFATIFLILLLLSLAANALLYWQLRH